jgi:Beta/Gamma crystallin
MEISMNKIFRKIAVAVAIAVNTQVGAQVIFYENEGYTGRSFEAERQVGNFQEYGFNDRASSVVVLRELWEVCEDARYSGSCAVLRPGRYPSLSAMGLNNKVSSVRTVNRNTRIAKDRYAPPTEPIYDNHRRKNERVYEANVTSVRAVVGPPERRCWIERAQAIQERRDNSPEAIMGALLGGILGHQISNRQHSTRDVERCGTGPSRGVPRYWDVSYDFRGIEHRIQTATPPGATVTVNRRGEPRA